MFDPNRFPRATRLLALSLGIAAVTSPAVADAAVSGGNALSPQPIVHYDTEHDYVWPHKGGGINFTAWPIEETVHGETHLFATVPKGNKKFKEIELPWNAQAVESPYASCVPTSTSGIEFTSSTTGRPETKVSFKDTNPLIANLGYTTVFKSVPRVSPYCPS